MARVSVGHDARRRLAAFPELGSNDALAVLAVAPTPSLGRHLSISKIASVLRRGGRQHRIDERAAEIQAALRAEQLAAPSPVSEAMGSVVKALVGVAGELSAQIAGAEAELSDRFDEQSSTSVEPAATPTTEPYGPSRTDSSASSTAASATTSSTTNTPPGDTAPPLLDDIRTWDV